MTGNHGEEIWKHDFVSLLVTRKAIKIVCKEINTSESDPCSYEVMGSNPVGASEFFLGGEDQEAETGTKSCPTRSRLLPVQPQTPGGKVPV